MRRQYEQTDEFKDRYRQRAGCEATMSEFDRRAGIKHLRVRGLKAVRYCAALKAVGINLFRAATVRRVTDFCFQAWTEYRRADISARITITVLSKS